MLGGLKRPAVRTGDGEEGKGGAKSAGRRNMSADADAWRKIRRGNERRCEGPRNGSGEVNG